MSKLEFVFILQVFSLIIESCTVSEHVTDIRLCIRYHHRPHRTKGMNPENL